VQTTLKLIHLLRRQRPHIVETHTAKAGAVGRLAARLAGVPIIIHVFHGHVFHSYFGPAKTRFFLGVERALARLTDRLVTISPAQRRDISQTYHVAPPEKVLMIPLGLDLQPFATAKQTRLGRFRAALEVSDSAPLVGFVGRLTGVKNPSLFVEAAQRVAQRIPQARFVFVGDGELRSELEQQVAELGLAQRVIFAGWRDDMPAIYADLDVMALTSLNEGTPITIIESLATGTPVVATAVGGVPDVVTDRRTGLLAPSGDADSLAQAIVELLQTPEYARALALAGKQEMLARFGLARLAGDMESLYRTLLKEKIVNLH
jgi:glycosyltransferase involved in cell wall biosynthesis